MSFIEHEDVETHLVHAPPAAADEVVPELQQVVLNHLVKDGLLLILLPILLRYLQRVCELSDVPG